MTGGAGFVGSHIVDALVHEGARVKVVDNFTRGGGTNLADAQTGGNVELVTGDIREAALWDRILPGVDVVFHQAALRVNRCEESPQECWDVMVEATRHLFNACAVQGVKKIVAASSAIVYGAADTLPTPETHHLNHNTTWYGAAKIMNEQLINIFRSSQKRSGAVLRYFNIYGPRMATQGHTEVLVKWFQALDAGQPLRIFGDGTQTMDWVHVKDVAIANILAAKTATEHGLFNIGTGTETSLRDLAIKVLRLWGRKDDPELVRTQAPTNPIPRRWADITAGRRELGFKPRFSLEDGLADMIHWWKDNVRTV